MFCAEVITSFVSMKTLYCKGCLHILCRHLSRRLYRACGTGQLGQSSTKLGQHSTAALSPLSCVLVLLPIPETMSEDFVLALPLICSQLHQPYAPNKKIPSKSRQQGDAGRWCWPLHRASSQGMMAAGCGAGAQCVADCGHLCSAVWCDGWVPRANPDCVLWSCHACHPGSAPVVPAPCIIVPHRFTYEVI